MNRKVFKSGNSTLAIAYKGYVVIKDRFNDCVSIPKALLDEYAEEYIKDNFKLTANDGWVRKDKKNGK